MPSCDHQWPCTPGEMVGYVTEDGRGFKVPASGPHRCTQPVGHVQDPTNDDHRCCCGASTWQTAATR